MENHALLSGTLATELVFSHEAYGESFYSGTIDIPRLSGTSDVLKILISEKLIYGNFPKVGDPLNIRGSFRSTNRLEDGRSRLHLYVFVEELLKEETKTNEIHFEGYVCKPPIYRETPKNRQICDLLIAVNRAYNKSDYIPCIAWGRNATFCNGLRVGNKVKISGRIQSRGYQKRISEDTLVDMVAYEVSISQVEAYQ